MMPVHSFIIPSAAHPHMSSKGVLDHRAEGPEQAGREAWGPDGSDREMLQ